MIERALAEAMAQPTTWQDVSVTAIFLTFVVALVVAFSLTRKN